MMGIFSSAPRTRPPSVDPSILTALELLDRRRRRANVVFAVVLLVLLVFGASDVYAASKTFRWTNPTQNTDGSALDAATLTRYDLGCTTVQGDAYMLTDSFSASLPLPTSRLVDFPPGSYWCALRVATADEVSDWSNEVFFIIPPPKPAAIDDLSVD